jgi:very-short-patch-repair endonuclease
MPFDPMRPFTTARALQAGLTKGQLRGPDFRPLLRGTHISSRVPYHSSQRTEAAVLIHPAGAVATHMSAARVRGAPVPADSFEHVTVARRDDRRFRPEIRCHLAALGEEEVRVVGRLRLSAPERMFVELAGLLDLVELVVVGDWLVKHRHLSPTSLTTYCSSSQDRHARRARVAAAYVRDRVDSPMESRLRMLIVLAGLPEPVVNLEVRDDHGVARMRLDLSYPRWKVAVEYDGRQHVEVVHQWERDIDRREDLDRGDWRLVVVTSRGIYREPQRTVERVWRALVDRGWTGLTAPTDGWRPHFHH